MGKWTQTVTAKVLGVGVLALLMTIPLLQVRGLVSERQQLREGANQPRFPLTSFAQEYDVVPGEHRPLELRQHAVVESDDAREAILAGSHPREQVVAKLALDRLLNMT